MLPFELDYPPETPIDIDGGIEYNYVIAQLGASHMTVDADADFDFALYQGSPGLLKLTFTGTVLDTPIYKTVTVRLLMNGIPLLHEPVFRILRTGAQRVPNIKNVRSMSVMESQNVILQITTDIDADSYDSIALPAGMTLDTSTGLITGQAPDISGTEAITLIANRGAFHYMRYFLLIVGTGYPPGGGGGGGPPGGGGGGGGGSGVRIPLAYDGDYTQPQIAAPIEYEVPFKLDPKVYVYRYKLWQFAANYTEPVIGDVDTNAFGTGGSFVGLVPGSFKQVGGGIVEFIHEYAFIPATRSEYESFVYSYQLVLVGAEGGITEVPITVQSRVQFDYFQTDDPENAIDLPLAPRAIQILNGIYLLHDWLAVYSAPSGTEFLATDATYKCWKGNIYERQQRFVKSISIHDIFVQDF